jgi:hypothetical protein
MERLMNSATPVHPVVRTVELVCRFEDGPTKNVAVEWTRGMTVLNALESASHKPHGITFRATGEHRTAFVEEIDGQANDSNGGWMYWVNGDRATVSCGVYALKARDIVFWDFVPLDPKAT